jgi:hypothetical protein
MGLLNCTDILELRIEKHFYIRWNVNGETKE